MSVISVFPYYAGAKLQGCPQLNGLSWRSRSPLTTTSVVFLRSMSSEERTCNQPPRSTQPGHPVVDRRNEYQPQGGDALRLGKLGVKAGMVRVWVAGKTV